MPVTKKDLVVIVLKNKSSKSNFLDLKKRFKKESKLILSTNHKNQVKC